MKKITYPLCISWIAIFSIISLTGLSQPLTYSIDSTSLQIIDWEGGHSEFEVADINDDGFNDILCVGDHGSPFVNTNQHGITLFYGNGTGANWTVYQEGDFGYGGIAIGDVNNDGFKDVGYGVHHNYASVDLGDQILEVALGNGTGTGWVPYDDSLGVQGQSWGMFGTDFADINNDGLLDIGSNAFGCCDGVHVHTNNGDGSWNYSYGFLGGNSNDVFRFGDFNNDGNTDFAVARQGGTTYFGDGTGAFVNKDLGLPPSGNIGYDYVYPANTDGDATSELVYCYNGGIYVYKWNETNQLWQNVSGTLPPTGSYYTVNAADFDNDGFMDLAAFSTDMLSVYTGSGSNVWTSAVNLVIPNLDFPQAMGSGDVDHNGRMDLILLGRFPLSLFTYINKLYLIKEITAVTTNSISALVPLPGQCYPNNSVRNITWNSTVVQGTPTNVNLELSLTGSGGVFDSIAFQIPNNGIYQWIVPDSVQSPDCVIRYTLTDTSGNIVYGSAFSQEFNIGCDSTTSLNSVNAFDEIRIYPNPSNDRTHVIFPDQISGRLSVVNSIGQVVLQIGIINRNQITLDLAQLHAGIYSVRVEVKDGVYLKKLMVVR